MNRTGSHNALANTLAGRLALVAAMAMALSHAACTRDEAAASGDAQASAPSATSTASATGTASATSTSQPAVGSASHSQDEQAIVALPLRAGEASSLFPIHKGVNVRLDEDRVAVSYTRGRGQPFGVAYLLSASDQPKRNLVGLVKDASRIVVRITTTPAMRPQLCLTDEAGNVWNAPLTKTQADQFTFDLKAVQPDPFQNGGRTLPAKPDLSTLRMLTLLDISGFMGAPEVPCEWTISSIELHRDGTNQVSDAGGAR